MDWDDITEIEIELSSRCNASCPLCSRELYTNYEQVDIAFNEWKTIFDDYDFHGMTLKMCGVFGDPILNKDLPKICEYSINKNANITISTNAGIKSRNWWKEFGELSKKHEGKILVTFAIDGLENTNHIYRVGVQWKKVWENLNAYVSAGGNAKWYYIIFDHNLGDLENAKSIANKLGIPFVTRKSIKNSLTHPEAVNKEKIKQKIRSRTYDMNVVCKYVHHSQLFISSTKKLWPCCFLHDELYNSKRSSIKTIGNKYGAKWNSLTKHSISDILNHKWFTEELVNSWNMSHDLHQVRCYKNCGDNGAREVIFNG